MIPRRRIEGFTLLEVMVAVAILAVAMSAIFSSEAGAVRLGIRAARTDTATILARCKMGEIEEMVLVEGLPAIEARGDDGCCEGAEIEGYRCEWLVERVVLPDVGLEEGAGGYDEGEEGDSPGGSSLNVADTMDSVMGGQVDSLVMDFAYPILKPIIEEQVRRATVTVIWTEGEAPQSFDVAQFLVSEQPAGPDEEEDSDGDDEEDDG